MGHLMDELRMLTELFQRAAANQRPSYHRMMALRGDKLVASAGFAYLQAAGKPRLAGGTQRISIEPECAAHLAGAGPAVAQMHRNRLISLAGVDPNRRGDRRITQAEFDNVAIVQCQSLRRARADQCRIVPGHLGQRFRQFLEPGVVSEAAIPNRRIGPKYQLQTFRRILPQERPASTAPQFARERRQSFGFAPLSGINPSCKARRHHPSKSAAPMRPRQNPRTMS